MCKVYFKCKCECLLVHDGTNLRMCLYVMHSLQESHIHLSVSRKVMERGVLIISVLIYKKDVFF